MKLRPATRLTLVVALLLAGGIALTLALLQLPVISVPFLVALALSYLIDPLLVRIEARGYSRTFGLALVGVGFVAAIALAIVWIPGWVEAQLRYLQAHFDDGMTRLLKAVGQLDATLHAFLPVGRELDLVAELRTALEAAGGLLLERAPGVLVQLLLGSLMVPLFAFFILRDGRRAKKAFLELVPNRHFEMTLNILYRMNQQVGAYLRGVLLEALCVGAVAFGVLAAVELAGVEVALPWAGASLVGGVVGITNLIPYFGPVAGGLFGALYVLFTGAPIEAIYLVGTAVAVAQLADNLLIGPLVLSRAVDVHPVMVVILLLLFGRLFGLTGLVVAVPLWAVIRVVLQETLTAARAYGRYVVER